MAAQSPEEGAKAATAVGLGSNWVRIPRVSRPPTIEDYLNHRSREGEAAVAEFRQREPADGQPVSEDTTAYLSYDQRNLYVVFVCRDTPERIRARLAKREEIFSDDRVGVFLDTFHDRQRAYAFLANPLGIQLDGITTEGQGNDYSFDTLWHSEGRLTADGFVVWMAIPFKSLRFSNAPAQTWGIALGRILPRNSEFSYWPYVSRRVEGFVPQFARLEGLEGISPGRNLQFIPYGIFTHARFLDRAVPAFRTDNEGRVGLDAKMILRDALTLDIALNPDFSQVESDEPQVTINQRFEVFFPEKRPFFIENAGYFQTPLNLFFSRRIADPEFGARLTGKAGRWALGGMLIDDRAPEKGFPEFGAPRGKRAGIGVVRVQREFDFGGGGGQSHLGILATSRDVRTSSNRVFSLDTRIKLTANWILGGQAIRSFNREHSGLRRTGPAFYAEMRHIGRRFIYLGQYSDRSPDFVSKLGFVPRVDIRQNEQFLRYFWRPGRSRIVGIGPDVYALLNWDRRGRLQDWFVQPAFWIEMTGQTLLGLRRFEGYELFQDREFRKHTTSIEFSTEWLKWMTFSARYVQGTGVNYFPPGTIPPFTASASRGSIGLTFRPQPRLRFDQTYLYSRLGTREGSAPAGFAPGTNIFTNHILRSKLNYQFTRALSLRGILDYNAVLANAGLVRLERTKRLTGDVLVAYLLHPGTALYIGYTDNYENLEIFAPAGPPTSPVLRRSGAPDRSVGRQFFVKLSYLFRF